MQDFNDDIFEVDEGSFPPYRTSGQMSTHELESMVGKMVANEVEEFKKELKKEYKRKTKKLKKELKKAKNKAKDKKQGEDNAGDLFFKAVRVSIESGLPELFRTMSARSRGNSKASKGG